MIPTKYKKSKLPKFLSYPVGAELISHELASVPQFEKLELSFLYLSKAGDSARSVQPRLAIHVSFSKDNRSPSTSNRFIDEGCYEENWSISVGPVPRKLKTEVKELLLDQGFDRIRQWLSATRTPTWLEGRKTLFVFYDPLGNRLYFEEYWR